jgi:hypothetical protein
MPWSLCPTICIVFGHYRQTVVFIRMIRGARMKFKVSSNANDAPPYVGSILIWVAYLAHRVAVNAGVFGYNLGITREEIMKTYDDYEL